MASKAMQAQFQAELDEAPYLAKLNAVLGFGVRFPSGPAQVFDYLYLGAEDDATDAPRLKDLGVTHVLNCAAAYINTGPSFYGSDIKYLGFKAEDDDSYNMIQHFDKAYEFIEDARKSGGKILLHCIMGINRSGLLTVAYCMVSKHMGPISAAKMVKKTRPLLLTNHGFQRQIITFAREKGLLHLDRDEL